MTTDILTAAGEEYLTKLADGTVTGPFAVTIGLYLDATDAITDADHDPATAITTEPTTADYPSYARQSPAMSAVETTADVWGLENDGSFSFTLDGTAANDVDAAFVLANFTSTEGGGAGDWIIATAALTQTRDAGSVDSIDYAAGEFEINIE